MPVFKNASIGTIIIVMSAIAFGPSLLRSRPNEEARKTAPVSQTVANEKNAKTPEAVGLKSEINLKEAERQPRPRPEEAEKQRSYIRYFNFNTADFIKKYNDAAKRLNLSKTLVGRLPPKIKLEKGIVYVYSHLFAKHVGIVITTNQTANRNITDLALLGQPKNEKAFNDLKYAFDIMIKVCAPQLTKEEHKKIFSQLWFDTITMEAGVSQKKEYLFNGIRYTMDYSPQIGYICQIHPEFAVPASTSTGGQR